MKQDDVARPSGSALSDGLGAWLDGDTAPQDGTVFEVPPMPAGSERPLTRCFRDDWWWWFAPSETGSSVDEPDSNGYAVGPKPKFWRPLAPNVAITGRTRSGA